MPIQKITTGIIDGTTTFANTAISGTITASQIAAVNANTITSGTIPVAQVPQLTTAKLPAGSVLQVVHYPFVGQVVISTGTATSAHSGTITPLFASSKILITAGCTVHRDGGGNSGWYWSAAIYRGTPATSLAVLGDAILFQSGGDGFRAFAGGEFLDSPASTSSLTYGIQGQRQAGTGTTTFGQGGNMFMTLMEIAA
jgi:hypothetical protein